MKKIIVFLLCVFSFLSGSAQNDNTGVAYPVKGANWHNGVSGKISKHIFEKNPQKTGSMVINVDGVEYNIHIEYIAKPNYYQVLFANGQFAERNRNYVYLNIGEYLWHFVGQNTWYVASCGNRCQEVVVPKTIEVVREVEKVVEKPTIQYVNRPSVNYHQQQPIKKEFDDCDKAAELLNETVIKPHANKVGNSKRLSFKKANRKLGVIKKTYPDCFNIQNYQLYRNGKDVVKGVAITGLTITAAGLLTHFGVKIINQKINQQPFRPNNPEGDDIPNPNPNNPNPGYEPGDIPPGADGGDGGGRDGGGGRDKTTPTNNPSGPGTSPEIPEGDDI